MTDLQAFKAMMVVGNWIGTRFPNNTLVTRKVAKITPTKVGFYSHRDDGKTISWLDWPKARELSRNSHGVFLIESEFGTMAYWSEEN